MFSVSKAERVFAATRSTLNDARLDRKILRVQMANMAGGILAPGGTGTSRQLDFSFSSAGSSNGGGSAAAAGSVSPYPASVMTQCLHIGAASPRISHAQMQQQQQQQQLGYNSHGADDARRPPVSFRAENLHASLRAAQDQKAF
jgi:hypothetical protein